MLVTMPKKTIFEQPQKNDVSAKAHILEKKGVHEVDMNAIVMKPAFFEKASESV